MSVEEVVREGTLRQKGTEAGLSCASLVPAMLSGLPLLRSGHNPLIPVRPAPVR